MVQNQDFGDFSVPNAPLTPRKGGLREQNSFKERFILVILCFLFAMQFQTAFAEEGWRVVPKAVWSDDLNAVAIAGEDSIWAAGENGLIIFSSDGGRVWQTQNSGTAFDLEDVFFVDFLTGWAAGESGAILATTDGGQSWKKQTSGSTSRLYSMHFIDASTGWIAGDNGMLLHTKDGGKTWRQKSSGTSKRIADIHFAAPLEGWFIERTSTSTFSPRSTIFMTIDGGESWQKQQENISAYFYRLSFANNREGWAVGRNGRVYHLPAGNSIWERQTSNTTDDLYDVFFRDGQTGWASGENGRIIATTDGGQTWSTQGTETSDFLFGIAVSPSGRGISVGRNGVLQGSENFGANWKSQNHGTNSTLYSVCFADNLHGWAVGFGRFSSNVIMHTRDGGETWFHQNFASGRGLRGVYCTDSLTAWVVGNDGLLLHTEDGGNTWQKQITETIRDLYAVYFTDVLNGWVVGTSTGSSADPQNIQFTTDGGKIWKLVQASGTTRSLFDVHFVDGQNGWACGDYGVIVHSSDGGTVWKAQTSGFSSFRDELYDVYFLNAQRGWIVGDDGKILVTTNGGTTWSKRMGKTSKTLSGVFFTSSDKGWAVGEDGRILFSADGNLQWEPQFSRTTDFLHQVFFTDARNGWAVGAGGTVLKFEGGSRYWADINDDGKVNIVDIQLVASRWGYRLGDSGYGAIYDVNNQGAGDGIIDIIDIQLVANQWGWPSLRKHSGDADTPANPQNLTASLMPTGVDSAGNFLYALQAENIASMTGFEFELRFDPAQLKLLEIATGTAIANKDQRSFSLGPVEHEPGRVKFGSIRLQPFAVRDGVVATFKIKARTPEDVVLSVDDLFFVDQNAARLPANLTTGVASGRETIPTELSLWQNYPNPFNPQTAITFDLPAAGKAKLEIYSLLGRKVATLLDRMQPAGRHTIKWAGKNELGADVSSGVYFYRLQVGKSVLMRKLTLMR